MSDGTQASGKHRLELWGGLECTVNRVDDVYFSQLERNGHHTRPDDLRKFAALGITALRYPILWERVHADRTEADWSWSDERLSLLRDLGVTPIAGLLHHGSGPRHTNLLDPEFPDKFVAYAKTVASRYPELVRYTPINEPLTTARFSALYGFWYPHARSEPEFWMALHNECKATVLAMAAIRQIRPDAQLVQTDDLGKTYSTPLLAYQAEFNNELRWLSWDLLCGKVDRHHYLWNWLTRCCRADPRELMWFSENACVPDMMGINYYVTSERVLDDNLLRHPYRPPGGNGRHAYVDIEAARCLASPSGGLGQLLDEADARYGLPIAITEAHIDSTREEQMRWLVEIWRSAELALARGVDVRAVTVWALLGSFDWNCLVTRCNGYYEPGPFDLRGPAPRPTALAHLMRNLANGHVPEHPVLSAPGWWRRPARLTCEPLRLDNTGTLAPEAEAVGSNTAPILITGASGTLASAFARACEQRGLNFRLLTRKQLDIADVDSAESALVQHRPWAIINTAGYVRIDDAERDPQRCYRENTLGPCVLASLCARHAISLLTFSSDLVFDGRQRAPYLETDAIAPLSVYGKSKAEAESGVLNRYPEALVVRTSSFFGPGSSNDNMAAALRAMREGHPFAAPSDLVITPTYVPDLVTVCLDLLIDQESGIWHLTNGDAVTWAELTLRVAELVRLDSSKFEARHSSDLQFTAPRPAYSALASERSSLMPSLASALERYLLHYHAEGFGRQ
jgi:dTDP-4-dehydrorhamnose reductase